MEQQLTAAEASARQQYYESPRVRIASAYRDFGRLIAEPYVADGAGHSPEAIDRVQLGGVALSAVLANVEAVHPGVHDHLFAGPPPRGGQTVNTAKLVRRPKRMPDWSAPRAAGPAPLVDVRGQLTKAGRAEVDRSVTAALVEQLAVRAAVRDAVEEQVRDLARAGNPIAQRLAAAVGLA